MDLRREDVEGVGLDLQVRADAAAQMVEKVRREAADGRLERAVALEKERDVEVDAQLFDVGELGSSSSASGRSYQATRLPSRARALTWCRYVSSW